MFVLKNLWFNLLTQSTQKLLRIHLKENCNLV